MGPFSIHQAEAKISVKLWLESSGELFVEVYKPHSGSGGDFYIVNSLAQFEELVSKARPGSILFVLREKQFPLRGIADDQFKAAAMTLIPEGVWYLIIEPCTYSSSIFHITEGNSHSELIDDLDKLQGKEIWLGPDPKTPNTYWEPDYDPNALIFTIPD